MTEDYTKNVLRQFSGYMFNNAAGISFLRLKKSGDHKYFYVLQNMAWHSHSLMQMICIDKFE